MNPSNSSPFSSGKTITHSLVLRCTAFHYAGPSCCDRHFVIVWLLEARDEGTPRVILLHEAFTHVLFSSLAQNISRTLSELSCTALPFTSPSYTAEKNAFNIEQRQILIAAQYMQVKYTDVVRHSAWSIIAWCLMQSEYNDCLHILSEV